MQLCKCKNMHKTFVPNTRLLLFYHCLGCYSSCLTVIVVDTMKDYKLPLNKWMIGNPSSYCLQNTKKYFSRINVDFLCCDGADTDTSILCVHTKAP